MSSLTAKQHEAYVEGLLNYTRLVVDNVPPTTISRCTNGNPKFEYHPQTKPEGMAAYTTLTVTYDAKKLYIHLCGGEYPIAVCLTPNELAIEIITLLRNTRK